jgi:MYXO-CTERM domain-containing protein
MHKHGMSPSLYGLSILAGAGLMLVATPAKADVELAPMVVIDFTELAFDGSGFDPEPEAGQLDSDDWSVVLDFDPSSMVDFGESAGGAGSDFARGLSTAGTDLPGIHAFDVDGAGLIALGVQPAGNGDEGAEGIFVPGQIRLRLVNNTMAEVPELQVEYTVWVNNDTNRSNSLNLSESADNTTYTQVGDAFESTGPLDKSGFVSTDVVQTVVPAAAIADGAQYYLAWEGNDVGDAGDVERDEFGIEGITIRILNVCGNGLMEGKEECDNGLDNSDTAECTATCTTAVCGDGFVLDGTEECDDGNTDPGDGCAADCTEEAATSDTDTDTDSDTDGSGESGSGSDTDVTATGASMTGASATSPTTTSPTGGGSDTDSDTGGEDDEESGCSCRTSGGSGAVWSMLGLLGLGLARRRRR